MNTLTIGGTQLFQIRPAGKGLGVQDYVGSQEVWEGCWGLVFLSVFLLVVFRGFLEAAFCKCFWLLLASLRGPGVISCELP